MHRYHNGNDQDEGQSRGFGHVGFLVDDLDGACAYLEANGVAFKKRPQEGSMRGLAFAYDPDNYWYPNNCGSVSYCVNSKQCLQGGVD